MTAPDPHVHLLHIRDCCQRIAECAALRAGGGTPDQILLDAVCRNLEILGEASRKVGTEFRAAHPEIPWREMNDLRNVLIHNYEGADPVIVWGVVEKEIPALLGAVLQILR
ncbi:MAG TPA: HepT-like ribonuclease domain-containing protein [Bryobacteraceae bacterium]|nr:HepT-like ribonuclease domain-containing protein [Bryobacteraceae bacterium]